MIKVLDVSYWQGKIDFKKVKSSGYDYAILRAGYGTTKDAKFDEYAKQCKEVGIKIGAYFFSYATNVTEAKKEAQKCAEIIKPYTIDLPVFYDFEYDTVKKAQVKGISLSKVQCSEFTIAFCEEIKKAGYVPGYYANTDYYQNMYTSEVKNKGYVFWLAHYLNNRAYHTPPVACDFFQYSDQGKVSGMSGGAVDLDVCLTEKYLNCRNIKEENKGVGVMSKVQQIIDDAVSFAVGIANDNSHGYSQAVRSLYNIDNPKSFDCSSLVLTSFYYAFLKNGLNSQAQYLKNNCSYTGNMLQMLNCGFEVVARNQTAHSQMVKGDVELNVTHHTALAIDRDNIVHARTSEGTTDTRDGSGNEIRVQPWYNYSRGWTHRLRFTGKGIDLGNATPSTTTHKTETFTKTGAGKVVNVKTTLNVRSGAGTNYEVLAKLKDGDSFDVGKVLDSWVQIRKGSVVGYVSKDYVSIDTVKFKAWVGKIFKDTVVYAAAIGKEKLNFYPKLNAENLVDVIGETENRYKVKIADKHVGYIDKYYVKLSTKKYPFVGICTANSLNVRTGAGINYNIIMTVKKNDKIDILSVIVNSDNERWYKVNINKKTGYVSGNYIKKYL